MTGLACDFCFREQVKQRVERTCVTKQVAILRRFRHAVVNTRHAAGDGADHAARAQGPHEVLEVRMEFAVSHRLVLLLDGGFVEVARLLQAAHLDSPELLAKASDAELRDDVGLSLGQRLRIRAVVDAWVAENKSEDRNERPESKSAPAGEASSDSASKRASKRSDGVGASASTTRTTHAVATEREEDSQHTEVEAAGPTAAPVVVSLTPAATVSVAPVVPATTASPVPKPTAKAPVSSPYDQTPLPQQSFEDLLEYSCKVIVVGDVGTGKV